MARSASKKQTVDALLDMYPKTLAEEAGVRRHSGSAQTLFQLMCAAHLMSARISADLAVQGTKALFAAGYKTAAKMAEASWDARTKTLNQSGYARYDERTSSMLGEASELLVDRYRGDLRKLRAAAGEDPGEERRLLKQIKGLGDVGVDIFFREVQSAWPELQPFADGKALKVARELELGDDAKALARLVHSKDLGPLANALVRLDLGKKKARDDLQQRLG